MRFSTLTLILASFATMSYALSEEATLEARSDDVVLNARELLEDLGMHARALKGAALSARRIEDLEARMLDLEEDLQDLTARAKKSDPYVCPVCDATFATSKLLTSHKDSAGHHRRIAPAPAARRK
ncbi:hypothetical protein H1R20_g6093, partial [Candolleomyces eurysporus]